MNGWIRTRENQWLSQLLLVENEIVTPFMTYTKIRFLICSNVFLWFLPDESVVLKLRTFYSFQNHFVLHMVHAGVNWYEINDRCACTLNLLNLRNRRLHRPKKKENHWNKLDEIILPSQEMAGFLRPRERSIQLSVLSALGEDNYLNNSAN